MTGILGRMKRLAALSIVLLAAACGGADRFPQTSLDPRSDFGRAIDDLFMLTVWLGVGVGLLVFVLVLYIIVRFRHRPGAPEPAQVHGNTRLELAWTIFPALILAIIAVPTVQTIFATQAPAPEDALKIEVIGYQWWWEFRYPVGEDTVVTANEVHIPVGRPIELQMTSADIIHSFWIPQMGGKRDVNPNRWTSIIFTAEEPGTYLGQCAEFCGESHALMKMRLIAHPENEFEEWLRDEAAPAVEPLDSAVIFGKELFGSLGCAGCHAVRGTEFDFARQGPDLTHFARRQTLAAGIMENNAQNLTAWLRDPTAIKPGALMQNIGWSDQDISFLVAYLQTLY
jgi:cytochrome c oxidase subunit II